MGPDAIYAVCRGRLLALAPSLTEDQIGSSLAATPPWTALDGYRHLAGVCADVLDGVMEGAGSPAWTAAQLAARAQRSLEEVCAEWGARGPECDDRMAAAGTAMAFVAFDVWTHEQDIRAAVGLPGIRDDAVVAALAPLVLTSFGPRYSATGGPPLRVILDGESSVLGDGEPRATLTTTGYELLRIVFGRRSEDQTRVAGWTGERDLVIPGIHLFDFPAVDILD